MEQPEDKLARAISAVKQGRKTEAERLLKCVVQEAPANAEGWLWLGAAVSSPSETLYCLERVLEIEPDNQRAQAGVQWAKAQLNRQPLLTPNPPSLSSESPSPRTEQTIQTHTQITDAPGHGQSSGALVQPEPGETIPLYGEDSGARKAEKGSRQTSEFAFMGQPSPVGAARPLETALAEPEHVSSHFFPNLIIAVLTLTLLLGLLIIVALLRAWLLP